MTNSIRETNRLIKAASVYVTKELGLKKNGKMPRKLNHGGREESKVILRY